MPIKNCPLQTDAKYCCIFDEDVVQSQCDCVINDRSANLYHINRFILRMFFLSFSQSLSLVFFFFVILFSPSCIYLFSNRKWLRTALEQWTWNEYKKKVMPIPIIIRKIRWLDEIEKVARTGLLSLVRVRLCTSRKIINTKNILLKWIITSTVHLQSLPYTLNIIYKNEKSYNEWERARIIRPTVLPLARPLALVRAFPHFHQAISFLLSIYYSESFVFSSLFFVFLFQFLSISFILWLWRLLRLLYCLLFL